MKPDFSESSYAYAVIREFETIANQFLGALLGPPIIPSLQQEKDLGYDVEIATVQLSLFLQFKLGWHVSQSHPRSPTWWDVKTEHYRIEFPVGHHQLPALQELEARSRRGSHRTLVRYYAPAFHDPNVFAMHSASEQVVDHSYGCSPSQIPADGLRHHLVTIDHTGTPFVLSEPIPIENAAAREILNADLAALPDRNDQSPVTIGDINSLMRRLCTDLNLIGDEDAEALDDIPALRASGIWANLLGVTPLLWLVPPS